LMAAERPVIVCGSGARTSGASCAVLELAERLAAPVACAHRGKGVIPEDHPLALGLCGAEARLYTNRIIADADVVLAVGMRFTEPDTSSWQPGAPFNIPPSKLIHIDIDPDEIARYYPTEVGIWADAKPAVEEIVAGLTRAQDGRKPPSLDSVERIRQLQEMRAEWKKSVADKQSSDAVPIRPERLITELRRAIPRDGFVFVDTGKVKNWAYQQFEVYSPDTFDIGIGWTPMGHSPAAALGVKLAKPERPVVAFVGDGSFQMVPWTLSTAVDYGIPITIVIFNDYAFGAVRDIQKGDYEKRFLCTDLKNEKSGQLFNPDFARMAETYGAKGERIEKPGDLAPAMQRALASGQPYVLDVAIDRDTTFPVAKQRAFRYMPKY
jgi:acetolactate synthase-1/2/3 large subunit